MKKHPNPSRSNLGRREKITLNFYFHTSLWCLKRFYLTTFIKPFEAPQRNVKIKMHGTGRLKVLEAIDLGSKRRILHAKISRAWLYQEKNCWNKASVIRQKEESQNGCFIK